MLDPSAPSAARPPKAAASRASAAARRSADSGAEGDGSEPCRLLREIDALRAEAVALEARVAGADTPPEARESLANLAHYLALRRHDLRPLQRRLERLGLSTLGRLEAHAMATLDAVARALSALAGERGLAPTGGEAGFDRGDAALAAQAERALGPPPAGRDTRIMVTLPSEAARDAALVRALIDAGMDIARINAAHDDVDTWTRMAKAVREAAAAAGRDCRIALDLAGPKLRTGPIEPGHAVLRLRPRRDELGRTIEPARVALVPAARTPPADPSALPVTPRLVRRARIDDTLELVDARGRARRLRVVRAEAGNVICATDRSTYLVPGTVLLHRHGKRPVGEGEVGAMMPRPGEIALAPGDRLDLVPGERTGHAGRIDLHGRRIEAPTVSCGVVEVFGHLRPGHRVLFDDGTIGAVVREVAPDRAVLEVVHCAGGAAKLRAQKGINLPDTALDLPALTDDDRAAIAFAARHADLVSASFVQRPEDVAALCAALAAHGVPERPIALKIETASAFARLPELLFAALRHPGGAAVMVARGDLAVEVGFERLAEVQEEILWLAEAAHLPVIWATQVLEGFARGGLPSRAEVTDAAMGVRAECVMLNKGPYVVETVDFLSGVLVRMRAHQDKKSTMLRRLAVSAFD